MMHESDPVMPNDGYLLMGGPLDGQRVKLADPDSVIRLPFVTERGESWLNFQTCFYRREEYREFGKLPEYVYIYEGA